MLDAGQQLLLRGTHTNLGFGCEGQSVDCREERDQQGEHRNQGWQRNDFFSEESHRETYNRGDDRNKPADVRFVVERTPLMPIDRGPR